MLHYMECRGFDLDLATYVAGLTYGNQRITNKPLTPLLNSVRAFLYATTCVRARVNAKTLHHSHHDAHRMTAKESQLYVKWLGDLKAYVDK